MTLLKIYWTNVSSVKTFITLQSKHSQHVAGLHSRPIFISNDAQIPQSCPTPKPKRRQPNDQPTNQKHLYLRRNAPDVRLAGWSSSDILEVRKFAPNQPTDDDRNKHLRSENIDTHTHTHLQGAKQKVADQSTCLVKWPRYKFLVVSFLRGGFQAEMVWPFSQEEIKWRPKIRGWAHYRPGDIIIKIWPTASLLEQIVWKTVHFIFGTYTAKFFAHPVNLNRLSMLILFIY